MAEAAVKQQKVILFPSVIEDFDKQQITYTASKNYDINRYEAKNGTVEPIRNKEDIKRIADYFWNRKEYRNWCLFIVGIHSAFRASDLLRLKVSDVAVIGDDCKLKVKDNLLIHLKEKKTGKYRDVVLSSSVAKNIQTYLDISKVKYDAWLFPSDKSSGKMSMRTNGGISIGKNGNVYQHEAQPKKAGEPLDVDSFGRIMRRVQKDLNLPYKLGTHSCRKTFGYWFMKQNQDDAFALAWLMKMLNHSSQAMTLHYIGLTKDDENEFYNSVDYGV